MRIKTEIKTTSEIIVVRTFSFLNGGLLTFKTTKSTIAQPDYFSLVAFNSKVAAQNHLSLCESTLMFQQAEWEFNEQKDNARFDAYELLEWAMMLLDDVDEERLCNKVQDALDSIWVKLTPAQIAKLNNRGNENGKNENNYRL